MLIAPDSFKGSVSSITATECLRRGWLSTRPTDTVIGLPMADGGEGTLEVIASTRPDHTWMSNRVTGPDGNPVDAAWLMLSDNTAVIELARSSGLPLMSSPDPVGATTRGFGELIAAAIEHGADRILVALGGSATTDAGLGALEGLGAAVQREPATHGAVGVISIDPTTLPPLPPEGITVLADTREVFANAAAVFGPQKGASADDIEQLTTAFSALASSSPIPSAASMPGSGAAGGTAWALASYLGAVIVDGSRYLGNMLGVGRVLPDMDYLITGEGRFDATSMSGKVVGYLYRLAAHYSLPGTVVVGSSDDDTVESWPVLSFGALVNGEIDTFGEAEALLEQAGAHCAKTFSAAS